MGYGQRALAATELVIEAVANGAALGVAAKDNDLSISTFHEVLSSVRELAVRYARVREIRADVEVDEAMQIADNPDIDPSRAKNMIDIRKWRASKHAAKTYGERLDLSVSGTVSVTEALDAARSRLLPMRDQQAIDAEVITDKPTLAVSNPSDRLTVDAPPAPGERPADPVPDIFS